ncbi:MAG: hypothetical protein KU38_12055 [Sulfurovum sp. FS08-3]|nr:MAG: hypothetical protein KU38_12055 [Sulfurovum sp. FS08-3]
MKPCLVAICQAFEGLRGFLVESSQEQLELVDRLFFEFLECFSGLQSQKLDFPQEFAHDVSLYLEGFEPLVQKFEDRQIRFLMLSDFYDYARLTKKYRP